MGTDEVRLAVAGTARPLIQNLGPGLVEFDTRSDELEFGQGVQIPIGGAVEFLQPAVLEAGLALISDTAGTDVRVVWFDDSVDVEVT